MRTIRAEEADLGKRNFVLDMLTLKSIGLESYLGGKCSLGFWVFSGRNLGAVLLQWY